MTTTSGPPTFPDTRQGALDLLHWVANEQVVERVEAGLESGELTLVPDPEVPNVWGVQDQADARSGGRRARVVLYLQEADFECDDEWL